MTNVINLFGNTQLQESVIPQNQGIVIPETIVSPEPEHKLFNVDSLTLNTNEHGIVPKKRGLFVDGKCINIVSDRYEVHQPSEIYQRFVNVAEQSNLTVNRVLPNRNTGGLLLSAKYDSVMLNNEKHDVNLTFFTTHDGKYKTFLTLDLLRMACYNQIPTLYANKSRFIFAEKHYQNALDIELIERILVDIPTVLQDYSQKIELMNDIKINVSMFAEMCREHYKMNAESKQYQTKMEKFKSIYYNAPGQTHLDNNAYKAYQAITYFNTHEGKNTANKMENSYIKGGNDSLKFMGELLAVA